MSQVIPSLQVMPSLEEFRTVIRAAEPTLGSEQESFRAAVFLIAAAFHGTPFDAARYAELVEEEEQTVVQWLQNLEAAGLIIDEGLIIGHWFDEEAGDMAFWCDVLVATGLLEVVP